MCFLQLHCCKVDFLSLSSIDDLLSLNIRAPFWKVDSSIQLSLYLSHNNLQIFIGFSPCMVKKWITKHSLTSLNTRIGNSMVKNVQLVSVNKTLPIFYNLTRHFNRYYISPKFQTFLLWRGWVMKKRYCFWNVPCSFVKILNSNSIFPYYVTHVHWSIQLDFTAPWAAAELRTIQILSTLICYKACYTFYISHFAGISQMFSQNTPQDTKHSLYTFHISCKFHVLLMPRKSKPRNPFTFHVNANPCTKCRKKQKEGCEIEKSNTKYIFCFSYSWSFLCILR